MLIRTLNAARAGLARLLREPRATVSPWRPALPQTTLDGLTPQRLTSLLAAATRTQAGAYLELAERMEEADLHYRSQVQTRRLGLDGLEPRVIAAGDRGLPRRIAQDLEEMLTTDWWSELTELSDGIAKGYSVAEILWDTGATQWRPGQIVQRPQSWYRYDPDDGVTLRLVDGSRRGAELVQYGQLVHEPPLKAGLPIRAGIARAAAWGYLLKQLALKRWSIGAELGATPWRIGRYPAGTAETDVAILQEAVRVLGVDGSAVFPDSMTIDLVAPGKAGGTDIQERLCRYVDAQVSKVVLGQTMTSDDGSSLSQAQVHNEVRLDILAADARALARTINRDLVRPWVDLNWGPQPAYPRIEYPVEWPEDLAALAQAVETLAPMMPIPASWVRTKWNIPEPDGDEPVLVAPTRSPEPGEPAPPAGAVQHASPRREAQAQEGPAPEPDGVDLAVAAALEDWEQILSPMVDPVARALAALGPEATAAEALAVLADVLPDADAELLRERLTQVSAIGRAAGAAGVAPEPEPED